MFRQCSTILPGSKLQFRPCVSEGMLLSLLNDLSMFHEVTSMRPSISASRCSLSVSSRPRGPSSILTSDPNLVCGHMSQSQLPTDSSEHSILGILVTAETLADFMIFFSSTSVSFASCYLWQGSPSPSLCSPTRPTSCFVRTTVGRSPQWTYTTAKLPQRQKCQRRHPKELVLFFVLRCSLPRL